MKFAVVAVLIPAIKGLIDKDVKEYVCFDTAKVMDIEYFLCKRAEVVISSKLNIDIEEIRKIPRFIKTVAYIHADSYNNLLKRFKNNNKCQ